MAEYSFAEGDRVLAQMWDGVHYARVCRVGDADAICVESEADGSTRYVSKTHVWLAPDCEDAESWPSSSVYGASSDQFSVSTYAPGNDDPYPFGGYGFNAAPATEVTDWNEFMDANAAARTTSILSAPTYSSVPTEPTHTFTEVLDFVDRWKLSGASLEKMRALPQRVQGLVLLTFCPEAVDLKSGARRDQALASCIRAAFRRSCIVRLLDEGKAAAEEILAAYVAAHGLSAKSSSLLKSLTKGQQQIVLERFSSDAIGDNKTFLKFLVDNGCCNSKDLCGFREPAVPRGRHCEDHSTRMRHPNASDGTSSVACDFLYDDTGHGTSSVACDFLYDDTGADVSPEISGSIWGTQGYVDDFHGQQTLAQHYGI
eukprot:TRINITY_DN6027_c0_g1_i1.p1 TRINITY_DN6027_c0_g1~~TRINITY_DN6027_c0_g1_i1.p1  ORF type:complete len:391 (-),score=67.50 TRINITY_DN6027_c0_g1_i1:147-1259(-)